MDLVPEAQTLFMVVQTVESGRPALMAHWRAGFWPRLREERDISQGQAECWMLVALLSGEDIAVEDLLDILGLQGWDSLKGSCDSRRMSLCHRSQALTQKARTFDGMRSKLNGGLACQCPEQSSVQHSRIAMDVEPTLETGQWVS